MAGESNDHDRGTGDETHNEISGGHVNGPVFQGRDFGEVNIGAPLPEEVAAYYRRMRQRLAEEERREREERKEELKVLRARRGSLVLRLLVAVLWFVWGCKIPYNDATPFLAGVLGIIGIIAGPIITILTCSALWGNRARIKELKNWNTGS